MSTLRFWVPPLADDLLDRTLVAHKSRGFCWLLTSPSNLPARSTLDLSLKLGIQQRLPAFRLSKDLYPVSLRHTRTVLQLAANIWSKTLTSLDTHWLWLELSQLDESQQDRVLANATHFLNNARIYGDKHHRAYAMQLSDKIPSDVVTRLTQSLASLEQALLDKDPMMPQHLRNTHSLLISYPETVHLLDDSEIARIIDAAEIHTKTEIIKAAVKGGAGSGSRKKISATDL